MVTYSKASRLFKKDTHIHLLGTLNASLTSLSPSNDTRRETTMITKKHISHE